MNNDINAMLHAEFAREEKLEKGYFRRLKKLASSKGKKLKRKTIDGHFYYYVRDKQGKWKYLGCESNTEVQKIKEARQLNESLQQIEINKKAIQEFERKFVVPDVGLLRIPETYRSPSMLEESAHHTKAALEWKRKATAFKNSRPVKRPEELKHFTNDGTKVRSKSEVIIYNLLLELDLVFVYELPTLIAGKTLTPDFTVYDELTDSVYIIEHLGMIDAPDYVEMTTWKLNLYHKGGYDVGDRLILTSDYSKGLINSQAIKRLLESMFVR